VQYARKYGEFEHRKAQVVGVSVDSILRNATMVEKLDLPFPLLSDPHGAVMKRYDVWDAEAKIAIPSIVVIDRSDTIRYLYRGRDFADRPGDETVFEALDAAANTEPTPAQETQIYVTAAEAQRPETERKAVSLDALVPYYRGVYFATVAMKGRLAALGHEYREGVRDISRYQQMTQGYSKALEETVEMKKGATA